MKITLVLPFAGLQGGIRVIAVHARALAARGHEVTVVSTPPPSSFRSRVKSFVLGCTLPWQGEPSYFDGSEIRHRVLERVRPVTDSDVPDADVVVATYYKTAGGVLALSPSKGAKAIFIQGYEVEPGRQNPELDASWRMPLHKIVVSSWLAALARSRFGDGDVSLVRNGVDTALFHAEARDKARVPTAGFVHSNTPLKGSAVCIAALRRMAAAFPELRVVSFGTERPEPGLRLPPNAEFHIRPPQEMLRSLYGQCDVWLCGSRSEGFGLPLLEAMACRCPVVSTRCGGPLDIVEDGVNGRLVSVDDDDSLADRALEVLRLPPPEWRQMSDAAHATAMRFSWDRSADLFEHALRAAIARNRKSTDREQRTAWAAR